MAAQLTAPLMPGMPAPNFTAKTAYGQPVSLAAYRGRRVWLAFFRHANCPFCHVRLREIRERQAQLLPARIQILAVFQSPPQRFTESPLSNLAWYPLISDPDEVLYDLYGLQARLSAFFAPGNLGALKTANDHGMLSPTSFKMDGSMTRVPGDYLIDADGVIRDMFQGKTISDSIPMDRVLRFAAADVGYAGQSMRSVAL